MSLEKIPQQRILDAVALLKRIEDEFAPAAFANSLGAEDMVLTDLIARHAPGIEMFTLDTGRLHEETYRLMQKVADQYDQPLRVYFPQPEAVQQYATGHGINAFYESIELRKSCCQVRKVEPLGRALKGKAAWITGLRREQAVTRRDLPEREFDAAHGIEKFNPLAAWSEAEVWAYLHAYGVPYNELHGRGFPSIGCAPCTRALKGERSRPEEVLLGCALKGERSRPEEVLLGCALAAGEDVRAGRWWWEDPQSKECGLHPAKRNKVAA